MTDNMFELDADRIRDLFTKLDTALAERGAKAVVYVVGGANMALSVNESRTTTDIDVVIKQGYDDVLAAARRVAEQEELGVDWLNTDFSGNRPDGGLSWSWFDKRDNDEPTTAYAGEALYVELASHTMMLALKTLAQRPQDMADIYDLMKLTGIRTPEALGRNLAHYTGPRIFDAQYQPWMKFHIDPLFSYIFDNLPEELRDRRPPVPTKPGRWQRLLRALGR